MSFQVPLIDGDAERSKISQIFKVGIAFIGGACLAFLSIVTLSDSSLALRNTSVADASSLMGMATSSRSAVKPISGLPTLRNLPGASPWKELALAGMEAAGQCSPNVNTNGIKAVMATMRSSEVAAMETAGAAVQTKAKDLLKAGQTAPVGFWDPAGYSTYVSEGRLLFFREAEIKHGRVCMLATLGIIVGENFHPLFGGDKWDGPATQLFPFVKEVPLADFWPLACIQTFAFINWLEVKKSFPTLDGTAFGGLWFMNNTSDEPFIAKSGRIPGDLGFDPLGLKPKTEKDFLEVQNKELNNGRLAMLAAAGIIAQEVTTGKKIFR